MQRSTPVIRVGDLGKTFRVPERETGLRAAARSLVRRRQAFTATRAPPPEEPMD